MYDAMRAAPVVPGRWTYSTTARGSQAVLPGRFVIMCDRYARRVTLRRIEAVAVAVSVQSGAMTITTDLGSATVPAGGVMLNTDRLLDAIAFSRGRFIVTGGGSASRLIIPTSPEAARSIEDCRI